MLTSISNQKIISLKIAILRMSLIVPNFLAIANTFVRPLGQGRPSAHISFLVNIGLAWRHRLNMEIVEIKGMYSIKIFGRGGGGGVKGAIFIKFYAQKN